VLENEDVLDKFGELVDAVADECGDAVVEEEDEGGAGINEFIEREEAWLVSDERGVMSVAEVIGGEFSECGCMA
jgi:hypothetical protein